MRRAVSTFVPRSAGLISVGMAEIFNSFLATHPCSQRQEVDKCFTRPIPLRDAVALATELSVLAVRSTPSERSPSRKATAFRTNTASPTVCVRATSSASPELVVTTFWARTKE